MSIYHYQKITITKFNPFLVIYVNTNICYIDLSGSGYSEFSFQNSSHVEFIFRSILYLVSEFGSENETQSLCQPFFLCLSQDIWLNFLREYLYEFWTCWGFVIQRGMPLSSVRYACRYETTLMPLSSVRHAFRYETTGMPLSSVRYVCRYETTGMSLLCVRYACRNETTGMPLSSVRYACRNETTRIPLCYACTHILYHFQPPLSSIKNKLQTRALNMTHVLLSMLVCLFNFTERDRRRACTGDKHCHCWFACSTLERERQAPRLHRRHALPLLVHLLQFRWRTRLRLSLN